MRKSKVINVYCQDRYCGQCKRKTKHLAQIIDGDRTGDFFIGCHFACLNCNSSGTTDYSFETERNQNKQINLKTISLPELNGLKPTLESTALKITEENGELCRAIGKFRGLSGEKEKLDNQAVYREIIRELLDVAQTAFTMMFLLEKEHDIDISEYIDEHIEKLINKGYIKTE